MKFSLSKSDKEAVNKGDVKRIEELADNYVASFPARTIAKELVLLLAKDNKPAVHSVKVTEDEMDLLETIFKCTFRVKGIKEDGTAEKRGRKKKES